MGTTHHQQFREAFFTLYDVRGALQVWLRMKRKASWDGPAIKTFQATFAQHFNELSDLDTEACTRFLSAVEDLTRDDITEAIAAKAKRLYQMTTYRIWYQVEGWEFDPVMVEEDLDDACGGQLCLRAGLTPNTRIMLGLALLHRRRVMDGTVVDAAQSKDQRASTQRLYPYGPPVNDLGAFDDLVQTYARYMAHYPEGQMLDFAAAIEGRRFPPRHVLTSDDLPGIGLEVQEAEAVAAPVGTVMQLRGHRMRKAPNGMWYLAPEPPAGA